MIFKRIDRYVSWFFLALVFGGLCLIAGLYTVFDLLKGLEDVQQAGLGRGVAMLAAYYAHLLPVFLVDITPAIVLVAAGMVMVHMAKKRELLALKASGTSVHRVTAPLFFWTVLISVAVFGIRETVGPESARRSALLGHALEGKVAKHLLVTDSRFGREVFVGEYDFATDGMKAVSLMEFFPDGMLKQTIQADTAVCGPDGSLYLHDVELKTFDESDAPPSKAEFRSSMTVESDLSPFDFVQAAEEKSERTALFHSLPELLDGMRTYPDVAYFRVVFHSRLASFFSPLLLLLVGIPCLVGFERSVNSLFLSVIVSIVVAAGYYALGFVLGSMGNSATISAPLAAWLPVIVVGSVGLWLFESMLT